MSVVVADIKKDLITMSADTLCTTSAGNVKRLDSNKIFKSNYRTAPFNRSFIWGSVGGFTDKFAFKKFVDEQESMKMETYEQIFSTMVSFRKWKKKNHIEPAENNFFLIGCNAGLFSYGQDGEIVKYKSAIAIGAGAKYAHGALHMGATTEQAVEAACYLSTLCGGEIITYKHSIK